MATSSGGSMRAIGLDTNHREYIRLKTAARGIDMTAALVHLPVIEPKDGDFRERVFACFHGGFLLRLALGHRIGARCKQSASCCMAETRIGQRDIWIRAERHEFFPAFVPVLPAP